MICAMFHEKLIFFIRCVIYFLKIVLSPVKFYISLTCRDERVSIYFAQRVSAYMIASVREEERYIPSHI